MLPEIVKKDLDLLIVGTAIPKISQDLGFYYLAQNDRLWYLLEYAELTSPAVLTPTEIKVLMEAKKAFVLDEMYLKLLFEKKESILAKQRIGITHLNRRKIVPNEDDPEAVPTPADVQRFVKKVEKYRPRFVAFVTTVDIFEKCFRSLYKSLSRDKGKQDFRIGESEVWFMGNTNSRLKNIEAMENLFDKLGESVRTGVKTNVQSSPVN